MSQSNQPEQSPDGVARKVKVEAIRRTPEAAQELSPDAASELLSRTPSSILNPTPSTLLQSGPSTVTPRVDSTEGAGSYPKFSRRGRSFAEIPVHTAGRPAVQPKLMVGPANDRYEQEADRVATQVMQMPMWALANDSAGNAGSNDAQSVQRLAEDEQIQAKPLAASITPLVQRALEGEDVRSKPMFQRMSGDKELQTKPLIQRLGEGGITTDATTIRRHPIRDGVHTPHSRNQPPHSDAEEEQAHTKAKEIWERIDAEIGMESLKGLASGQIAAKVSGIEEASRTVELQLVISQLSKNKRYVSQIRTFRDKVTGRLGTVGAAAASRKNEEERAQAQITAEPAGRYLMRAEGNALEAAEQLQKTVSAASLALAEKAAGRAAKARDDTKGFQDNIVSIEKAVAKFSDIVASVISLRQAADKAVSSATASATAAARIVTTRKAAEEKAAELSAAQEKAGKLVAAQETLRIAEENLLFEQGLGESLEETLQEIENDPDAHLENIAAMRLEIAARLAAANQAKLDAEEQVRLAQEAVALVATLEPQRDLTAAGALAAATAGKKQATSASAEVEIIWALRALAGNQKNLDALLAQFSDKAQLKLCLEALGYDRLINWLKDPAIGQAKTVEVINAFGLAPFKSFLSTVGGWADDLVRGFSTVELREMTDDAKLGTDALKELIMRFGAAVIKTLIAELTLATLKGLLGEFTAQELKATDLTAIQIKDLLTKFTGKKLKSYYTEYGATSLKDFLTKFTAAELHVYITTVGEARFTELVKVKKLKAASLHKYTAPWLKTFVGAGATALAHLMGVYTKADGVISGGHEPAVFQGELNRIIRPAPPPPVRNGRITSTVADTTHFRKVLYTTHFVDGSDRNSGPKTLIKTLAAEQDEWKRRGNEAVWESIRTQRFNRSAVNWTGASDDGISFEGYYTDPNVEVSTFYPVV